MHVPLPGAGYILGNQTVLPEITAFIRSVDPDIVGLVEVDTGSIRSRRVNQAEKIAGDLGLNTSYEIKYGARSINQLLPIIRKQGNAFLAAPRVHGETFHYFDTGIKRLIIELEMEDFAVFLVHLSLKYRHRHLQLRKLYDLIEMTEKPVIVVLAMAPPLMFTAFAAETMFVLLLKLSCIVPAVRTMSTALPVWVPARFQVLSWMSSVMVPLPPALTSIPSAPAPRIVLFRIVAPPLLAAVVVTSIAFPLPARLRPRTTTPVTYRILTDSPPAPV